MYLTQYISTAPFIALFETFRFEDQNDQKYEISLAVFSPIVSKIDTPECFIVLHFKPGKLALLSLLEAVTPSSDGKKITLLTFDNSFTSLRDSRLNSS